MATVVEGDVEWDDDKAAQNLVKHGISFAEAATVFVDPFAVYLEDGSGTERLGRHWQHASRSDSLRRPRRTRASRSSH